MQFCPQINYLHQVGYLPVTVSTQKEYSRLILTDVFYIFLQFRGREKNLWLSDLVKLTRFNLSLQALVYEG